ncbi:DUF6344 domain-containing protein [Streptomyces sp. NPDC001848]|uniref:DUF6344 domain-containing protein n=1 Tax=Streptomyces sp. NPDC001848 TaxID=3364618 RepID=UPI00368A14B2
MARNKVMKLWTAVVSAFLALCAALGFATTTAATAAAAPVPQPQSARTSGTQVTLPVPAAYGHWARGQSLPPTMKQRIRAEAHGSSPSCRHRPSMATAATTPLAHRALHPHEAPRPFHEETERLRS